MNQNNILNNITKIALFSLPICAGLLINMISSFAAMMMVAHLGKMELAAGALCVSSFITIATIVITIFYALGILISHARGQNKSAEEIGLIVKNGFWLAIMLMIPSSLLIWNIDKVLILFKQDPALIALTPRYFHFAALSIIPTLIGAVIGQFFTGIGKPRFMMLMSTICLPFIILFSYGFVLGNFGLPKMGLGGVTCATFIVQSCVCIGILLYIYFAKHLQKYHLFGGSFFPTWRLCKKIFLLGLPIGVQFGAELAAMSVSTYFMGYCGIDALAASQVVQQYSMLIVMVILGLSQGLAVLTSEAYGKQNFALVKEYIRSTLIILASVFTLVFAAFLIIPKELINFYAHTDDAILISLASVFFVIAGFFLLIDGIRNILSGVLRGLHDSKAPMQLGVICLWFVSLPLSYFIGFNLHGGPIGLRLGFMSGFLVAAILLGRRIQNKLRGIRKPIASEAQLVQSVSE